MSPEKEMPSIILFHYKRSPYAGKVTTYLRLLGQDYAECIQPVIMPRPDLSALGVSYRRIPVCAINGQIYCDTHLITKELEKIVGSNGCLGETEKTKDMQAMEDAWEDWADATFFTVVKCLPKELATIMPPGFWEDRMAYAGTSRPTSLEEAAIARKKGLVGVKMAFEHLEYGVLADNRPFLLSGRDTPTLADLKSSWVLEFAKNLPGVLSEAGVTAETFPKTLSWIERFRSFVNGKNEVEVRAVSGKEAKEAILHQYETTGNVGVAFDQANDLGLVEGSQKVEVLPTDVGRTHPQAGSLVGLDSDRLTLETKTPEGSPVLVHFPRRHFEIVGLATRKNELKL
ncbi:hypothetical protein BJ508DRAFT_160129 [Ascobolus immersus RN42]|uniref:Uncharacterized protein n=1 Tax=Ascobolus immersus RN42 TaxID=1160509 RepID=A0A3N4HWG1_ASCIM|nr:hypothetical protein BJ508DRAFT_160129 [Ascobolus immersus RN42]